MSYTKYSNYFCVYFVFDAVVLASEVLINELHMSYFANFDANKEFLSQKLYVHMCTHVYTHQARFYVSRSMHCIPNSIV